MKTLLATLSVLLALSLQSLALVDVMQVTPADAAKYGIKISTHQSNPHQTGVWLDFKADGELKGFHAVQLSITKDGRNLVALSLATEIKNGVATAMFNVDPSLLPDCRLMILNRTGERSNSGYAISVKEFAAAE